MRREIIILLIALVTPFASFAQKKTVKPSPGGDDPVFKTITEHKATSVKDQARTSTCWCFATTSFIESELLRTGKGEFDLSEMFIIRYNYFDRIRNNYLRLGKGNTDEGGQSHDWFKVFVQSGIVPDDVYPGLNYGSVKHNHRELNSYLKAVAQTSTDLRKESEQYLSIINSILDTYLGKIPQSFTYNGVSYTPQSFARSLEINPADYVEITSLTHFPFYTKGVLEVPDNWRMESFYNVPVDELIAIMDHALKNGYTVNWDGDTSEDGFSNRKGYAQFSSSNVTQEMRQEMFENFTTTDDHLMHITGISEDQQGNKFYITKNSWGPESNKFGGYLNMSEQYVRAKTLFIMVHKNSIPPSIKSKLGL